jgi:hypothetical protein
MCRLGDGLKSGKFPAILYSDGTTISEKVRHWLDIAGANYTVSDAKREFMEGPVLVVDGTFLSPDDIKHVLGIQ